MEKSQKTHATERISWHSLPLGDVFVALQSRRGGLAKAESRRRLEHFGLNALHPEEPPQAWRVLARQFLNPLILILLMADGITFYMRSYLDAVIILVVVGLNTIIGFVEEQSAEKTLTGLKKLEIKRAVALRDGEPREILAQNIVPGDIILLRPGNKVPADARLTKSYDIETDEGILTGESLSINKNVAILGPGTALADRANTVFNGTTILDGAGEAVVFATGESTELGRVSQLLKNIPKTKTPFERKVTKLGHLISLVVVVLSAVLVLVGVVSGRDIKEMFLVAVAVAVSAVPESLPVAITVILVVGMRRILKAKGLVRSLAAAETLGSTSVILTDKTGTLTQGQMQVAKIVTPERRRGILELNAQNKIASNHLLVLSYGFLTSEVVIENPQDELHTWRIHGRPVDKALVVAGIQAGLDYEKMNKKFKKVSEVTFSSSRKFSATVREVEGQLWFLVVGAPDILLPRIKRVQILDRYENLTESERLDVKETIDDLAKSGLRVLAVCSRKISADFTASRRLADGQLQELMGSLSLVGLVAMKDPVREDVKDFISLSQQAGIHTVMVTGDHSLTARSVAKEVGLLPRGRVLAEVLEGEHIEGLDIRDLAQRVRGIDIFSRVTPDHKLKIVEAWQNQGETVAVLGDGVNDAPALRRADIGVAVSGAVDLAQEASDIILLESNFSTLIRAVQEGRVILDNIKKVIAYLLSTSFSEIILVSLSLFFGLPLPVIAAQILWVNLVQDSLPAVALALDPAEKDVMASPPASLKKPLLDGFIRLLIGGTGVVSALMLFIIFYFFQSYSDSLEHARSVTFVALGVTTLCFSFSIRSLRQPIWVIPFLQNKYLLAAVGGGVVLLAAAVYLPPLQVLLRTQPLGWLEWVIVVGFGILSVILVELTKWYFTAKHKKIS